MGMLIQYSPPLPELRPNQDANPGLPTIQFQFQPQGVVVNAGANWASGNAQGRDNPILQWARSQQRSISFEAKLYAETITDNIDDKIAALFASVEKLQLYRRPPVWTFVWGNVINETVVVESIGNVRYDEIRQDGSARGVLFAITLLRYVPFDIQLTDPSAPLPSTYYKHAAEGDLWESVALREYGDPALGDLLRRRYPDLEEPGDEPGRVMALPPLSVLQLEVIAPESIPLARTEAALALRQEVYEDRAQSRESSILKR